MVRLLAFGGLLVGLAGCTGGHRQLLPQVATQYAYTPTATPAVSALPAAARSETPAVGLYDLGQFLQTASGDVQASNRTATVVVHLSPDDVIHAPPGVRWGELLRVGANQFTFLMFNTELARHRLFIWIWGAGADGAPDFERIDATTYHVLLDGDVQLYVDDVDLPQNGAADHTSAINRFGHLLVDPNPVPAFAVVIYGTGEGLDVSAATRVGTLPQGMRSYVRTGCDSTRCFLMYPGEDRAPVDGTVVCGATVSLYAPTFRLAFEPAPIPPGLATPYPTPCQQYMVVQAGDKIPMPYAATYLKAYAAIGAPLSIVVAGDGTLYVGTIVARYACGPCRGT